MAYVSATVACCSRHRLFFSDDRGLWRGGERMATHVHRYTSVYIAVYAVGRSSWIWTTQQAGRVLWI
jgi:hypothetical protein